MRVGGGDDSGRECRCRGCHMRAMDFAGISLYFERGLRFSQYVRTEFKCSRWSAWPRVFFPRCTHIRSLCMSNGMPSGQAVPAVERFPSEKGDSEFPRYPLPRGIDIYSRLLLPHSSTPVTQRATPTIARWWGRRFWARMPMSGMPHAGNGFCRDFIVF